jgi:hypothetical protein
MENHVVELPPVDARHGVCWEGASFLQILVESYDLHANSYRFSPIPYTLTTVLHPNVSFHIHVLTTSSASMQRM